MELSIRNVEEVSCTDNLLRRNGHETDLRGVAAELGSPVAEELLVCLDTIALGISRGPFEVYNTLDFDGGLVQQIHPGQLVDRNGLALEIGRASCRERV